MRLRLALLESQPVFISSPPRIGPPFLRLHFAYRVKQLDSIKNSDEYGIVSGSH
jgi:hypothetical protein